MFSTDRSTGPGALPALRRAAGLSQRDLAERSGLGLGTVRDLEQGRIHRPRPASLRRLASALGMTERQLDLVLGGVAHIRIPVQVGVLGPLTVRRHGTAVDLGPDQQRAVFGLLALHAGEPVRRGSIIQAIWDAHPPRSATNLVQVHVSRLRRLLEPDRRRGDRGGVITSWSAGYRLDPAGIESDLAAFRRWVRAARSAPDAVSACDRYLDALALWRGDPLCDVETLHADPSVVVLARERADATLGLADAALAIGRADRAVPHLIALTHREPLHGAAHARLMLALASQGERAAALRVFDRVSRRLADELDIGPDAELVAARQRVLHGQPSPATLRTGR